MLNRHAAAQAIQRRDFRRALELINLWQDNPGHEGFSPLSMCYAAQYAALAKDVAIRDLAIHHAENWKLSQQDGYDYREGIALTFLYIGLAFLPDHDAATEWLDRALAAVPGLFPATIEREIIRRDLNRDRLFAALGDALPHHAWQYEVAASELGLPTFVTTRPGLDTPAAAVGIRGRCDEHTPALMRLYRRAIGQAPLLICTWDHTPRDILAALSDICDEVVLIPDVDEPGFQNRARQICLAQALLDACASRADLTLMTRTDIALFRPHLLDGLTTLWQQYPIEDDRLAGRIIVPDLFTRRYMSDHPSDLIMFGATRDLQTYWAASPTGQTQYFSFAEQYLSRKFRETLGIHSDQHDLQPDQYLKYLRDYFIVRDFTWFEAWWIKRVWELQKAVTFSDYSVLVTQSVWESLYYGSRDDAVQNIWAPGMRGALLGGLFPRGHR